MRKEGAFAMADLRVPPGHRNVIEEDVALGMATDGYDCTRLRRQDEPRAGIRPTRHHEDGAPGRDAVEEVAGVEGGAPRHHRPATIRLRAWPSSWVCSSSSTSPERSSGAPQEEQKLAPLGLR